MQTTTIQRLQRQAKRAQILGAKRQHARFLAQQRAQRDQADGWEIPDDLYDEAYDSAEADLRSGEKYLSNYLSDAEQVELIDSLVQSYLKGEGAQIAELIAAAIEKAKPHIAQFAVEDAADERSRDAYQDREAA